MCSIDIALGQSEQRRYDDEEQNPLGSAVVLAAMLAQSLAAGSGGKAADDPMQKIKLPGSAICSPGARSAQPTSRLRGWLSWSPRLLQEATTFVRRRQPLQIAGKAPAHIAVVHWKSALRCCLRRSSPNLLLDANPRRSSSSCHDADKPSKLTIGTIPSLYPRDRFALRVKTCKPRPVPLFTLAWMSPTRLPRSCALVPYNPPKRSTFRPSSAHHNMPPRRGRIHDRRKSGPAGARARRSEATDLFFILATHSKTTTYGAGVLYTDFPTMA